MRTIFSKLSSKESCEAEVKKEIDNVQEGEPGERRNWGAPEIVDAVTTYVPLIFSWF